jgi:hypothetical protein
MRRELGQLSLADGVVDGGRGATSSWRRSRRLVKWGAFERLLGEIYAAQVGRPSYGPLVPTRCRTTRPCRALATGASGI